MGSRSAESPPSVPRVFVSYRRDDADYTDPVVERLRKRLRVGDLFVDRYSISAGTHWGPEIEKAIRGAVVLLALIGDHWLGEGVDSQGRRIDRQEDWVRREVALGLECCEMVVPVLLGSAKTWFGEIEKPPGIEELWARQAISLRSNDLDRDLDRLWQSFLGCIVTSAAEALESLSLAALARSSNPADLHATALVAVERSPHDFIAQRALGICELRLRKFDSAWELLSGAHSLRPDCPTTRYYLALAAMGGTPIGDLSETQVYEVLDLIEPDGTALTDESHLRALLAAIKLDYFKARGRNTRGLEDDLRRLQSSDGDWAELHELLDLARVSNPGVRERLVQ